MDAGGATPRPPAALYVHFPFCLSICPYCDFVVYAGRAARGPDAQVDRFVDALVREIELRGNPGAALGSVYLGGGTPSLMSARQVERVVQAAASAFGGFASAPEITIEVNPGARDRGDLAGFRAAGVTRVSIGAQSFDEGLLARLGRRHAGGDIVETVHEARAARFESVSVDLLYDVPGQTIEVWRATLEAALALGPDHVSTYALTLDHEAGEGSDHLPPRAGATRWRARSGSEQDEDRAADMYELADEMLARAGLAWYEISNWSRPGHESRHNLVYWRGEPWEAVGPGAHRFDGERRSWNAARLDTYLAALEASRLPPTESAPEITPGESVALSLRTRRGVPASEISDDVLAWAATNDLTEPADRGAVRLTRKGRLMANEVAVRLVD